MFRDVSSDWQIAIDSRYDACAFSDIDHDGRLDVYVNGTVTGGVSYPDHVFRNTGTRFEDVTPDNVRALQADHGVQWADFDRDGDEDLALTGVAAGRHALSAPQSVAGSERATGPAGQGRGRPWPRDPRRCGGTDLSTGTRTLLGARLVDTGSGYDAQNEMPVHFGVAGQSRVDVEVIYPTGKARKPVRRTGVRIPGDRFEVLTIQVGR